MSSRCGQHDVPAARHRQRTSHAGQPPMSAVQKRIQWKIGVAGERPCSPARPSGTPIAWRSDRGSSTGPSATGRWIDRFSRLRGSWSFFRRRDTISPAKEALVSEQCRLLQAPRSSHDQPRGAKNPVDLPIMHGIDELYTAETTRINRKLRGRLRLQGCAPNRGRIHRHLRVARLEVTEPKRMIHPPAAWLRRLTRAVHTSCRSAGPTGSGASTSAESGYPMGLFAGWRCRRGAHGRCALPGVLRSPPNRSWKAGLRMSSRRRAWVDRPPEQDETRQDVVLAVSSTSISINPLKKVI